MGLYGFLLVKLQKLWRQNRKWASVRKEAELLSASVSQLKGKQSTEPPAAPGRMCCGHLWVNWEVNGVTVWKWKEGGVQINKYWKNRLKTNELMTSDDKLQLQSETTLYQVKSW